jgi:hypothetical protein
MPICRINAIGRVPHLAQTDRADLTLAAAIKASSVASPIVIMVHGYGYAPSRPHLCPHDHIFKGGDDHPLHRAQSWPLRLGYGPGTADCGLCIAFGWNAGGSIWRAHHEAGHAGLALASLIRQIAALTPSPVHIIAHSLGARVALAALPDIAPGQIGKMILMTGAELKSTAETALSTPAGLRAQVLNVISRENDIFDFMYEWLLAPHRRGARALGAGLALPHCVTAQIDHPDHLAGLRSLGLTVTPAAKRMCHWSSYLRPGLFGLYRAFLAADSPIGFADIRAALPSPPTPRWSGLRRHQPYSAPIAV